jgi:hypothetical protein
VYLTCFFHCTSFTFLQGCNSRNGNDEDANESGCLICVAHQAFIEQVEKSINQSYEDDPGVNKAIETFLDTIEYVLFFPINYGVNLLVG